MDLDARKYKILKAIIDDYILTAMPVGSRTISRKYDMGLSSATIRNEMSDLEELGYLDQPHTSAGRVPSWRAYRLYVDQLMRVASLPPEDTLRLRGIFQESMDSVEDVLTAATRALSELTDYTGVMIAPSAGKLKRVQLVPITESTALMVTVTENGVHKDAMIPVSPGVTPEQLFMLSGYLTERLQGKTLNQLLPILQQMRGEMSQHRALFSRLMDTLTKQLEPEKSAVVVGGTSKLLFHPEYSDIQRARSLLSTLETKEQLASLLAQRSGLAFSVTIGPELQLPGMQDCSLVTVSYNLGEGSGSGTMGVIGPTRMHYARVLSVLNAMRKALEDTTNRRNLPDEEG